MSRDQPLVLMASTVEMLDPALDEEVDVPCVRIGDVIIWTADPHVYWDRYGDGGASLVEVCAEGLAKELRKLARLAEPAVPPRPFPS